jgi:hypothetical protein
MAKQKIGKHGLPQNEGQFKLKGLVVGKKKDDFFTSKTQKNGLERNTVKFALKTSPLDNEVYVEISDSEKEDAWFYKQGDKKAGIEGESKKISWGQRNNFHEEGFQPIGVSIGLDKDDADKNVIISKHDYDAAEYVSKRLEDDKAVMAVGEIEFSSFDGEDGKIRSKKLKIKKIYNSFVDFEKDDFVEENYFKQTFVYMDIDQAKKDGQPDKEDPRFIVKGKIVGYSTLEDVEFVLRNKQLAQNFKKKLKPYNCIEVHGAINNLRMTEEVEETNGDDWGGESNPFDKVNNPRKFEFEIKGINTKNIDIKTYTEANITEAFKADEEFGNDEWSGNSEDTSGDGTGDNEEFTW